MRINFYSGFALLIAITASASASAVPVTMTLESLLADQNAPYHEQGFIIQAPGSHLHNATNFGLGLPGEFTNGAQMAADTSGSTLTREGGGAFNLLSLEAAAVSGSDRLPSSGAAYAVKIEGFLGTVSQGTTLLTSLTAAVIDFSSWSGSVDEVQFSFYSQGSYGNFSTFSGDDFKFDNIKVEAVSAVPVPAAVWLFFSALTGLGVMRKKQVA